MSVDHVIGRLQELPPPLPDPGDRFERVVERVRRRRRRTAAIAAVAASAGVVAVVVLTITLGGGQGRAVDPVEPATSTGFVTPVSPLPGGDAVEVLSEPLTTFGTGKMTVDLGPRPDGATAVRTGLGCLTAGTIKWPDGAGMRCSQSDAQRRDEPVPSSYQLDLAPEQTTLTMEAKPGVSWKLVTTYVRTEPTDWGTNAEGNTYGVMKPDGSQPDLVATYATNGRSGYVYADELDGYQATSPADALRWQEEHGDEKRSVTVYESDGQTVVGEFIIEPGSGGPPPRDP